MNIVANITRIAIALTLLATVSACATPPGAPAMIDYSYIPPNTEITVATPNLDDY